MQRKAIIGAIIGLTLGCLVGAITQLRQPAASDEKPYVLSVNQRTGKPQLHVKGKPEIN